MSSRLSTAPAGAPRPARGADRTADVAAAALDCFSEAGYRLTQIADVSERLGVSVGSIYRYVESKEGLLYLAVLQALDRLPAAPDLPIKVSGFSEAGAALAERVAHDRFWPMLSQALGQDAPADTQAEARTIAGELFDVIADHARVIWLLDRCSRDVPELAEVFDRQMRQRLMSDLLAWVARRRLAPEHDAAATEALARGAMEAVAWLAKGRAGDPGARNIDRDHARAAAVRIFSNAFHDPAEVG